VANDGRLVSQTRETKGDGRGTEL